MVSYLILTAQGVVGRSAMQWSRFRVGTEVTYTLSAGEMVRHCGSEGNIVCHCSTSQVGGFTYKLSF